MRKLAGILLILSPFIGILTLSYIREGMVGLIGTIFAILCATGMTALMFLGVYLLLTKKDE